MLKFLCIQQILLLKEEVKNFQKNVQNYARSKYTIFHRILKIQHIQRTLLLEKFV